VLVVVVFAALVVVVGGRGHGTIVRGGELGRASRRGSERRGSEKGALSGGLGAFGASGATAEGSRATTPTETCTSTRVDVAGASPVVPS